LHSTGGTLDRVSLLDRNGEAKKKKRKKKIKIKGAMTSENH